MVGEQLRVFAGKAVRSWLEENEDEIRAAIIERLNENDIAEAFADVVGKQVNDNWAINVEFYKRRE